MAHVIDVLRRLAKDNARISEWDRGMLTAAANEIARLRAAEPAPKLVGPERITPPDPAWWASDLPELRERLSALETWQRAMPLVATKGDLLEVDEKLDQHFDSRCDNLSKRLDALELERRQEQVVRDWTEWRRVDPERAERWRREHVRSIDDLEGDDLGFDYPRYHAERLREAGYKKVPSVKNDARYVPYWQRWESERPNDWFEFPHDLPLDLVWKTISEAGGIA